MACIHDIIRHKPYFLEHFAFFGHRRRDRHILTVRQRVPAPVFLIPSYEHIVRRVKEKYLVLDMIVFEIGKYIINLIEKHTSAHIGDNRHFIKQVSASRGKLHKRRNYSRRNIINAVKAYILKHISRLGFSGSRHSRNYKQLHIFLSPFRCFCLNGLLK